MRRDGSRIQDERDLYLRLLGLGDDDVVSFLDEALDLLIRAAGAERGYLALFGEEGDVLAPRFWRVRGCGDEEAPGIRERISTGIVGAALAEGRTVHTTAAVGDRRFQDRASVRAHGIRAVICAPLGEGRPLGVVYLQRDVPGPFPGEAVALVEVTARAVTPHAARLLGRLEEARRPDPTSPYRHRLSAEGVVGSSPALARVLGQLALAARSPLGVLLTGPTGTGKSMLARVLHDSGRRASGPFVAVNCANLAGDLVESTLFGHVRGGFTGAVSRREGQVARAQGGTLFLDEVGDLPPPTQARLLTFLDTGEFLPVGGDEPTRADVRVVAATHRDLRSPGGFRQDLYYRLAGYEVRVPALAERREDVPALARHLCARYAEREGLARIDLSPAALRALAERAWPGNLRELDAWVTRAVDRAAFEGSGVVTADLLEGEPAGEPAVPARGGPDREGDTGGGGTLAERTRRAQRRWIAEALAETGGGVEEAARRLGIGRSRLYEMIRDLGIERRG